MHRNRSIQLKAAFLIIVFSLNTIIGFACAVGIDMGFNASHHHEEGINEASEQMHHNETKHKYQHEVGQHHDEADNDHQKSNEGKDDCCNHHVTELSQLDKTVPHTLTIVNPKFFNSCVVPYSTTAIFYTSRVSTSNRYFVRNYHPPIPDIRIAIQSFQI